MSGFMKRLEDQVFRSAAPLAIRHLSLPDLDTRDPVARAVLDQAAQEFQVAPPLTIHISDPNLLAGVWHATREAYVVNPKGRARREAVAAAVSTINTCPYCVTVHEGMFAAAGGNTRQGAKPALNPEIDAARDWAAATLSPGSRALANPGIAAGDIPQIYGTAAVFHYINRMVSVFLADSPMPVPGMTTKPGQKLAKAALGVMSKRMARVDAVSGQSAIREGAPLPHEFAWARPDQSIADALAHFAMTAEAAGENAIAAPVRELVQENLNRWQGEEPPLSRAWLEDAVTPIDDTQKPAARLALLVARAPWQVDDKVIADFCAVTPGDKALVQTAGWAAYTATRRIAGWFNGVGGTA